MNAGQARIYIFTAGLVILAFLAWRQIRGHSWRRTRKQSVRATHESEWPGHESSLYPVLELLNRQLTPRPQGEPLRRWIDRLSLPENLAVSLDDLVTQHYRLRFDPNTASSPSAQDFSAQCRQWMESYQGLQAK